MDEIRGNLRIIVFHKDDHIGMLSALCPACDFEHSFRVDLVGHGKWENGNFWSFDGNYEKPTFSPSMLSNPGGLEDFHPICHSFLENGIWRYLGDCTHDMANQEVPMIPPVPDMPFGRRHGWHLNPKAAQKYRDGLA